DGHNGDVPELDAQVERDHTVFVGSDALVNGHDVFWQDEIPAELKPYLPARVLGKTLSTRTINGDLVFQAKDVRQGNFKGLMALPPYAPKSANRPKHFVEL